MSAPHTLARNALWEVRLLFLMRVLRMWAFGSTGVILAVYLHAVGLSDDRIGLLLSLTLVGDAALSLLLTGVAERLGKWNTQLLGCILLAGSALVFASPLCAGSFWLLTAAATVGVLSPSGNEVGPFMALEQSMLAQLLPPSGLVMAFSWYNLVGYLATALGAAEAGFLVDWLQNQRGLSLADGCRAVFLQAAAVAAALTAIAAGFLLCGREAAEQGSGARGGGEASRGSGEDGGDSEEAEERRPLLVQVEDAEDSSDLASDAAPQEGSGGGEGGGVAAAAPRVHSRGVLLRLGVLFSLDAFAGSLVTGTLVAYYFSITYPGVSTVFLGNMLLGCNVIAGISSLFSARLASAIGLVNTMVFTHAPSNIFTALVPVMPNQWSAMAMLFARFSISQMDVAPRQTLIAGMVRPDERTALMGAVNVARSIACSFGPLVTGALAGGGQWAWAFYLCGGLKLTYDGLLLLTARHLKVDA